MIDDKARDIILKFVLQNAVFYSGSANQGAVLGKVISIDNSLKSDIPGLRAAIDEIINQVNSMPLDEQKEKLGEIAPELLEKEKKEEGGLSELEGAEDGKVVTRFAPSPTGPLTLGQFLRAVTISHAYAEKYNGKFILRIEDTDAKKIKIEFIEWIKDDLKRCGIVPDKIVYQSERMEIYYEYAQKMVEAGVVYVCACDRDKFREYKSKMIDCPCREGSTKNNLRDWEYMKDGGLKEGSAVLRLKTSMNDKNPVMRDPPIFRINFAEHPMQGTKYKAWPLYNFACAVDDYTLGITHVFRGKEHEHNTAVQNVIYDFFKWKKPYVTNFGMIRFPGAMQHTRDMREAIDKGEISGWDDPILPTIRALLRRGFVPEALREFSISCGLSKNDIQTSWENLEAVNKKYIDTVSDRYMVVTNPIEIFLEGMEGLQPLEESLHPDHPEHGTKKMPVDSEKIFISGDDFEKLKGKTVRLKGLFNIKLEEGAVFDGNDIIRDMPKIQWVSVPNLKVEILTRDGIIKGVGEKAMEKLKVDDIIQMERIGFGRIDKKEEGKLKIVFGHR